MCTAGVVSALRPAGPGRRCEHRAGWPDDQGLAGAAVPRRPRGPLGEAVICADPLPRGEAGRASPGGAQAGRLAPPALGGGVASLSWAPRSTSPRRNATKVCPRCRKVLPLAAFDPSTYHPGAGGSAAPAGRQGRRKPAPLPPLIALRWTLARERRAGVPPPSAGGLSASRPGCWSRPPPAPPARLVIPRQRRAVAEVRRARGQVGEHGLEGGLLFLLRGRLPLAPLVAHQPSLGKLVLAD